MTKIFLWFNKDFCLSKKKLCLNQVPKIFVTNIFLQELNSVLNLFRSKIYKSSRIYQIIYIFFLKNSNIFIVIIFVLNYSIHIYLIHNVGERSITFCIFQKNYFFRNHKKKMSKMVHKCKYNIKYRTHCWLNGAYKNIIFNNLFLWF